MDIIFGFLFVVICITGVRLMLRGAVYTLFCTLFTIETGLIACYNWLRLLHARYK